MNRERAKELLPVIQAFAEGKQVESRNPVSDWCVVNEPVWNEKYDYRIKPEPIYGWIVTYRSKCSTGFWQTIPQLCRSEEEAKGHVSIYSGSFHVFKIHKILLEA